VTFTGTAAPGSAVALLEGTATVAATTATAAGTWSLQAVGVSDGAHLYRARASTLGGTSPDSAIRVIQVDTNAPAAPTFESPAAGSSVSSTFTLTGTGESGSTLELFEDGVSRGTVAVSGSGTWTRQLSAVSRGTHGYTARATDMAGNVSPFTAVYSLRVN
jgi:hypothetical protein